MPKPVMSHIPERPKPWRPWQGKNREGRIVFEPARIAPIGGACFAVLALAFYLFRQVAGSPMAAGDVLVGVALVFVAGYAATGIFVYWLLLVADRELPSIEEIPSPPARETKKAEGPGANQT
jgi:hypothetical protein